MSLRNPAQETLHRLDSKTLDAPLRQILVAGLNCSPFEASAVIAAAQEVYFPFIEGHRETRARPGRVTVVALAAEEPAGKAVADCAKRNVSLHVASRRRRRPAARRRGPPGFRRQRIPELCQEALSQGALLTREDLAWRIFLVGLRTISRATSPGCASTIRVRCPCAAPCTTSAPC